MYAVAQPTSFPASAGVGGNNSNSYYGDQAGLANTGTNNTFIGAASGLNCTTGVSNTFLGSFAGGSSIDGVNNTFVGSNSGGAASGSNNTFIGGSSGLNNSGELNVFIGSFAGINNFGNHNLFAGANSGYFNTDGQFNTFLGSGSGRENVSGNGNVFVGYQSGEHNNNGTWNTFVGFSSGANNTSGNSNSFFGYFSGVSNTGNSNTFLGGQSGISNSTGSQNTFVGTNSGYANTTGTGNVFLGQSSGSANTTGSDNTFVGLFSGGVSTGNNNTYVGRSAGQNSVNGSNNVFLGANAGEFELGSNRLYISNSSVSNPLVWGNFSDAQLHFNAAVGIGLDPNAGVLPTADFDLAGTARLRSLVENEALTRILVSDSDGNIGWKDESSLSTISDNLGNHQVEQNLIPTSDGTFDLGASGGSFGSIYLTESVLLDNSVIIHNNNNNTAFGINALSNTTTGTQNVAVGHNSAALTSTGSNNVSLGWNSLSFNTTGSSNTAIGFSSGPPIFSINAVNSTSIGNSARAGSNAVRLGNASVTSIGGYAAWTNLSDGRFKDIENSSTPGLEYVLALRPVSYKLKREALHQHLREEGSLTTTDNQRHFGFIAQEVLDLDRKLSLGSAIVDVPETEEGVYGIRYDELTAIYAKSIQELSAMVNEQKQEIAELKALFSEIINTPVSNQITPKAESSELDNISFGDINPNPFDHTATIEVNMPRQIPNTMVVITDLQGGVVKEYPIQRAGETKITVSKTDLKGSGIYLYSLVAGGSVIKTKRMIIR
jgi:hypothetical protein